MAFKVYELFLSTPVDSASSTLQVAPVIQDMDKELHMTDTNTATTPAAETAPAPVADENPNVFTFVIPGTDPETQMAVDIGSIPAELRMSMLQIAVRQYVTNSVNQVAVRYGKELAPFNSYDEAMKADPFQTAVAKPAGERPTLDVSKLIETAKAARERLYKNEVRKQGDGTPRKKADPLDQMVTRAVVSELFEKKKASDPKYKYVDATSEVSKVGGGIAYLDALIAEKVAAGGDKDALEKFKENRYINPAKLMLGQRNTNGTKDQSLF